MTTLADLMSFDRKELHKTLLAGHPLDPDQLAGHQYLGVDLSLPGWARKILWHTFRKTFHRDGDVVRGWNVRVEQTGIDAPTVAMTKKGEPMTFGHYRVTETGDVSFPGGYRGAHFLDYGAAGNTIVDPAALGYTPLVAVNAGSQDLLLGWEIFKVGPLMLPLPLYWALRLEGPLDAVVDPPRPVPPSISAPLDTNSP
jgi:hypothetical protein